MRFSERIHAMQASPIRKLAPYGLEAKARGKKVYHLNIGQPDIKTPPSFFEAIRHFDEDVLAYGPSEGNPKLIEAIIEYYKDYHIDLEKGNILITAGASEAIVFAFTALCDPGDEILIPEPFYANYNPFAEWVSARIVPITTKAEEGFRLPPTETIEKKITPRTRAIVMCHPGNPTGMVYSREDMERIGHLALKHDFYIVADEVYREFVYDGLQYVSFGNLEDVEDRVLIMDSVSKRYSACGARIGCIVSKNKDLMGQIVKLCQSRTSAPTIDQVGAVALYGTSPSYLQEVNREYQKRRDIMYQALKCMPGVICEKPKGAFYMMVKLPVDDAEKFIIWMLKNFDSNGETVMAAPGEGFYATPGLGQDEARLAYVLEEKELVRAMEVLKAGLEVYPGRIEAIKA